MTSPEPVSDDRPHRSRLMLLIMAGVFLAGLAAAYVLVASGWRPARTSNHGELVQPPRAIVDGEFTTLEGNKIRFSELYGKWTYVYFVAADCTRPCEANLYKMRQVVLAQGKEAPRVQRVLVLTDTHSLDWLRYTLEEYPGMRVITGPPAAVEALARQFVLPSTSPREQAHWIYLIDPLGHFMMSYPASADPSGMRKDLARLLRVSRIG